MIFDVFVDMNVYGESALCPIKTVETFFNEIVKSTRFWNTIIVTFLIKLSSHFIVISIPYFFYCGNKVIAFIFNILVKTDERRI
jgi:hypothetical protein